MQSPADGESCRAVSHKSDLSARGTYAYCSPPSGSTVSPRARTAASFLSPRVHLPSCIFLNSVRICPVPPIIRALSSLLLSRRSTFAGQSTFLALDEQVLLVADELPTIDQVAMVCTILRDPHHKNPISRRTRAKSWVCMFVLQFPLQPFLLACLYNNGTKRCCGYLYQCRTRTKPSSKTSFETERKKHIGV